MDLEIIIGESRIREMQKSLGSQSWPEFMQHDRIVNNAWPNLYNDFLDYQFALIKNGKAIGIGNTVHLNWQYSIEELPENGLDWAMVKSKIDIDNGLKPNLLIGVQILIDENYLGQGISYKMLNAMREIAKDRGLKNIALPVRPTIKHQYPLIPMNEYIKWKNSEGLPFDPWIRVHVKLGGQIIRVCKNSMDIEGSVSEWEEWTGLQFPGSGDYVVDKALIPVKIDKKNNIGNYIEPNVWMVHKVD